MTPEQFELGQKLFFSIQRLKEIIPKIKNKSSDHFIQLDIADTYWLDNSTSEVVKNFVLLNCNLMRDELVQLLLIQLIKLEADLETI